MSSMSRAARFTVGSRFDAVKVVMPMTPLSKATAPLGRLLLSVLFFISGAGKVTACATAGYMAWRGVPGALLRLVVAAELLGALAIAPVFHISFASPVESVMFLKNLSIAGGFLLLAVHGASGYSLDARRER